jgi:hypothetical protein
MGKTLTEIAEQLKDGKPIQLIYAFNGTGKTRLSREFRLLVDPKSNGIEEQSGNPGVKVLYFNAFTEDLFYWDNDLNGDVERKLKIQSNSFTNWVLAEQGQEPRIIAHFQRYTHDKLTPRFNQQYVIKDDQNRDKVIKAYSEVTFSVERGDDNNLPNIKISKGEESNFVWCIFYSLLEQIVEVLNVADPAERETDRFNHLRYIFIDDPVSSLDDNHLIELAVDLAQLIKSSRSDLKFIISTHSPLFYNVLHNELGMNKKDKREGCFLLEKHEDGSFDLNGKFGDSNRSFSYHLHLKGILERAIADNRLEKFHFTLLRNLYEKTAAFLGYQEWSALLPEDRDLYYNRIIQFASHSTLAHEVVPEPTEPEKQTIRFLLDHLSANYRYRQQEGVTRD